MWQEEYWKRKLQKEIILKDRINHTTTTSSSQIPFKGGKGRSVTMVKKDTRQQTQALFPDELEEILDDEVWKLTHSKSRCLSNQAIHVSSEKFLLQFNIKKIFTEVSCVELIKYFS